MDECLLFIYRVTREAEYNHLDLLPKIDNIYEETYDWIFSTFKYPQNVDKELLARVLGNLSELDLHKLYFKNNAVCFFIQIPEVKKLTKKLVNKTKSFIDPNNPPKEILPDLELLWEYFERF